MISGVKSEPATSPVIGTILLVAIAVVLVAIILVAVMGFSGDTNERKIGLNAKAESGTNAALILYGGASIPDLVRLEMIDQDSPTGEYVRLWDISDNGSAFVGVPYTGDVARPQQSMGVYDTRINVKGTFADGSEAILLVQPMTFQNVQLSKLDFSANNLNGYGIEFSPLNEVENGVLQELILYQVNGEITGPVSITVELWGKNGKFYSTTFKEGVDDEDYFLDVWEEYGGWTIELKTWNHPSTMDLRDRFLEEDGTTVVIKVKSGTSYGEFSGQMGKYDGGKWVGVTFNDW